MYLEREDVLKMNPYERIRYYELEMQQVIADAFEDAYVQICLPLGQDEETSKKIWNKVDYLAEYKP